MASRYVNFQKVFTDSSLNGGMFPDFHENANTDQFFRVKLMHWKFEW